MFLWSVFLLIVKTLICEASSNISVVLVILSETATLWTVTAPRLTTHHIHLLHMQHVPDTDKHVTVF